MDGNQQSNEHLLVRERIEAELREIQARLESIRAQMADISGDLRIRIEKELETLRSQKVDLHRQLDNLCMARTDVWENLRDTLTRDRRFELADGLEVLAARLR